MADPLSLLRQYNVSKKEIVERNGYICFGEYCWPKKTKTNYLSWQRSQDEIPTKNYYTLECLVYLLKNVQLQHSIYVRQAAAEHIPVVSRPDRKDLLAYLSGEINTSASIDRSAPLELPIPLHELQNKFGKNEADKSSSGVAGKSSASHRPGMEGDEDAPDVKKMKLDNTHYLSEAKKQFSDRLDAPKIKKLEVSDGKLSQAASSVDRLGSSTTSSLKEALSQEQIAALKAKRMAKKRMTIIDAENELDRDDANATTNGTATGMGSGSTLGGTASILFKYDAEMTRDIQSKERVWRNRATILQSTGKNFAKSIFPTIQAIKIRDEGSTPRKPMSNSNAIMPGGYMNSMPGSVQNMPGSVPRIPITQMGSSGVNSSMPPPSSMTQQQYNRYDQERFNKSAPSNEFRIDTTGSYHGFNLKNVTEIPTISSNMPNHNGVPGLNHPSTPSNQKVLSSVSQSPMISPHSQTLGSGKKRTSRTPIIIIPATTTSLITLSNAKAILQDLKYIDSKSGEMPRDGEILIQRRKQNDPNPVLIPYKVIDNPLKLGEGDWERVVAVFVQGPAWQFKGWPWNGNPVEIFSRIKAFHLKWDEMKLDTNVSKWNVQVIQLSRNKRHLDRANLLKFWSALDSFMLKNKHYLRF